MAAEALLGRDFHEKTFIRSFNLRKCTGVKLQTHVWKSPVQAATSYMGLIKWVHSALLIHPHHTINAEGCQIASSRQRDCNKALTLIRTNVGQEKEQTEAESSLVRTLCGGLSEEGGAGWLQSCLGTLMLTRCISDMFTLAFGAQLSNFK